MAKTDTTSLAERLQKSILTYRKVAGLSQEACAAKLGISTSMLSMVERGQRTPPLKSVDRMAKRLGMSGLELLGARAA